MNKFRVISRLLLLCLIPALWITAQENPQAPSPDVSLVLPPSHPATPPSASAPMPGAGALPPGAAMPPGAMPQQEVPPTPLGRLFAIHASGAVPQKLKIDKKLKSLAPLFTDLPYTSYEALAVNDRELPWGEETLFPINALYAMKVAPLGTTEEGAVALQARVEMLKDGDYVNALDTLAEAYMNQALLFRGLPLGSDELLLVLVVTMPSDDQQDDNESQDEDSDSDEENEDEKDQDNQDQEEEDQDAELLPQEGEDEDEQDPSEMEESQHEDEEEPEEQSNENLEALLQSLEETDKREQVEERNKRKTVDIKGNWW